MKRLTAPHIAKPRVIIVVRAPGSITIDVVIQRTGLIADWLLSGWRASQIGSADRTECKIFLRHSLNLAMTA
jgi:hypothetical protein